MILLTKVYLETLGCVLAVYQKELYAFVIVVLIQPNADYNNNNFICIPIYIDGIAF